MSRREEISLHGRVAAITGGARGIGRSTAAALLREGARVAIGDVDGEAVRRTADELGGGTVAFDLDVTDRASFEAFVDGTEEALGPLDVLVNNAGVMPAGPFLKESDETAIRQVDINVHGVILGTKIALPGMIQRGRGHIVNLASAAGKAGVPGIATYCATKHAVVGVSEALRGELRGSGVEFTIVMPALVNTELIAGARRSRGVRVAEPEDVADAIVAALRSPKFDVYVPPSVGRITRFSLLLPRRAREAIARAMATDKILTEIDWERRAAYERRIASSKDSAAAAGEGAEPEVPEREPVAPR